jgi:hypothetical protein
MFRSKLIDITGDEMFADPDDVTAVFRVDDMDWPEKDRERAVVNGYVSTITFRHGLSVVSKVPAAAIVARIAAFKDAETAEYEAKQRAKTKP